MRLRRRTQGFTLTELAVVFAIIILLLGGAMMTLSSQVEQRNNEETLRRLNAAAEALQAFAVVHRRLPCPAVAGATGVESPAGGGTCTSFMGGFLPALSLGLQPTDSNGYAVDVWGNPLRYAVSNALTGCSGTSALPHFTNATNLQTNGISCRPNDLDICSNASCTGTRVVSQQTVAFLVYSTGKNGAVPAAQGADELENTDGDARFVSRTPSGSDSTLGTYDDVMVFVPVGTFYSRLIAAGLLP